jgi:hypothetical protein
MRPLPPAKNTRSAGLPPSKLRWGRHIEIYKTNPIFLSDRAVFVIKPAGGQGREGFTGVGEDRGRAR